MNFIVENMDLKEHEFGTTASGISRLGVLIESFHWGLLVEQVL